MEARTVEQIESWSTRSFSNGFAGLRELSDGEFSGAVEARGAYLFMLNGRIIGVYEGSLDDFENAGGTAYAAPHPSLPLLFSMQEEGGETQAKYYTNDTPISEVSSTLTEGGFTGYVELSENVLSGDYYVAYYGGRSMSVAFVGTREEVVTGDDAFERAEDEVGIYEVRDVDIEVTDVPEPEEPEESDAVAQPSAVSNEASDPSGPEARPEGDDGADGRSERSVGRSTPGGPATAESSADDSSSGASTAGERSANEPRTEAGVGDASAGERSDGEASAGETPAGDASTATAASAVESAPEEAAEADASAGGAVASERGRDDAAERSEVSDAIERPEATDTADRSGGDAESDNRSANEADTLSEEEWRETTTIPSLDPDHTDGTTADESRQSAAAAGTSAGGNDGSRADATAGTGGRTQSNPGGSSGRKSASGTASASGGAPETASSSAAGSSTDGTDDEARAKVEKLQSQLEQREQQVQQLKDRLSKIKSESDEYERERDALRQEVKRLEAKLESVGSTEAGDGGRQLDGAQALDGTNLFVRYESKGDTTLEEAAENGADAEDVNANLRLEHHTQFEDDGVRVGDRPFEEFLTDSFEYRFVSWVIEDLLYEIRDTGHKGSLRDLYESIPKIDRIDLRGSVSAGSEEEGTRKESFDVIMRDRMGVPLIVADLNDSRDPTTGDMMGSLVDSASGIGEAHDELAGAFQVTESFFEPKALETAEAATTGGFLTREKRESFVKLSRKRGYHLCLVESRSGGFHLNVPEL